VQGEEHGIMFLCEAAMGKTKEITSDDSSLVKAPAGFDSIIAKGTQAHTVDCLCRRTKHCSAASCCLCFL
jgi:hypothetical protein